ncbi:hypothetical protein ACHAXT_012927 [Thalassiosira profunda]
MKLRGRTGESPEKSAEASEAPVCNVPTKSVDAPAKSAEEKPGKPTPKRGRNTSGKAKKTANRRWDEIWDEKLAELKQFKEAHGHMNVPKSKEHKQLGSFVNNQRQLYRRREKGEKTSLTEGRIRSLEELGFAWAVKGAVSEHRAKTLQAQWEQRMQELKDYKAINGHCNVPIKTHKELGKFVMNQRHFYKAGISGQKNSLTPERINDLEEIGFVWNLKGKKSDEGKYLNNEEKWQRNFEELKRFKETYGHVNVTKNKEFEDLGQFCGNQRHLYRRLRKGESTSLTNERIKLLSDLGFEFKSRSATASKYEVASKTKGDTQIVEKDKEVALPDGSRADHASKETSEKRMVLLEDGTYLLETTTKTDTTKIEHCVLPEEILTIKSQGVTETERKVAYPDGSTVDVKTREICKKCLYFQPDGTQVLEIKTSTCVTRIERTRLPTESGTVHETAVGPLEAL